MARTPLFKAIQRALREAMWLERNRVPSSQSAERLEEARARAVSRRRFLQGGAALLGAATLGNTVAACGPGESMGDAGTDASTGDAGSDANTSAGRVVIVGAGLAGLAAAYRLARNGVSAELYEADSRVGGRAFTMRDPMWPTKVELGGELIDTPHTTTIELARELGLTVLNQAEAVSRYEGEFYFIGGMKYTRAQMAEMFRPVAAAVMRDLLVLGEEGISYEGGSEGARALDRKSIATWLDEVGVRSGPLRTLLDVSYTSEYGREIAEQTALNLIYLIGTEEGNFELFGDSDELFTIREGNDALATGMHTRLMQPARTGHKLTAVRAMASGDFTVVFDRGAGGGPLEVVANRLVIALPFSVLREVELTGLELPPAQRAAIMGLPYGTNAKVMIATTGKPWYMAMSSGSTFSDNGVYHESWETSRGYEATGGVLTNFSGGRVGMALGEGTPEMQGTRFAADLDRALPGVQAAYANRAARMFWPTAPFAKGSYACYAPGNYEMFYGSEGLNTGRLHFCGEHTHPEFAGFMNGAIESGFRVAQEIMGT